MKYRISLLNTLLLVGQAFISLATSEPSSKNPRQISFRTLEILAGIPQDDECGGVVEEIQRLIQLGIEEVPKTDETDVIILVGLSGSGKSTLTQFIANNSNTLQVECVFGKCKIVDDSGTIGGDPISETFVPNLVVEDVTGTPFFDMPGFDDTRNETTAIANALFMKQIISNAKRMKIIIVVQEENLDTSDRISFVKLIKNLLKLFRYPENFENSLAIIATQPGYHESDGDLRGRFITYLQDITLQVESLFDAEEFSGAHAILNILNQTLDEDPETYDPKYFEYFKTPLTPGLLIEDEVFVDSRRKITSLIMERLEFAQFDSTTDFGLPLTDSAVGLLNSTVTCISRSVSTAMDNLSIFLYSHIIAEMNSIDPNENMERLSSLLINLTSADYGFVNDEGKDVEVYLRCLIDVVSSLDAETDHPTLNKLEEYIKMISVIVDLGIEFTVEQKLWVLPLIKLLPDVTKNLTETANAAQISTKDEIQGISSDVSKKMLLDIDSLSYEERIKKLEYKVKMVAGIAESIRLMSLDKSCSIVELLTAYEQSLSDLYESEVLIVQKKVMAVFAIFSETTEFDWRLKEWDQPLTNIILLALQTELHIQQLFNLLKVDLSTYQIQSGQKGNLAEWWSYIKRIDADRFKELWLLLTQTGLFATEQFEEEYMSSILLPSDIYVLRLESLLNVYLDPVSCSEGTDENTIVVANFLSIKKALRCLPPLDSRKSITFMAMDTLYVDSSIIGLQYTNNLVVKLIAPTIFSDDSAVMDLTGKNGENESDDGSNGAQGHSAGNFYFTYDYFDTRSTGNSVIVKLDGGEGGNGGHGLKGRIGPTGDMKSFSAATDCVAWNDGDIQVRVEPSSCGSQTRSGYCYAGSNGIEVWIDGKEGGRGEAGGKGGDGGAGGSAGCQTIYDLGLKRNVTEYGTKGLPGNGGSGGPGGPGGRQGDYLVVRVDDICCRGLFEYYCTELGRRKVQSNKFRDCDYEGPLGQNGHPDTREVAPQQPNYGSFNANIQGYLERAKTMTDNVFIGAKLSSFVTKLQQGL